MATKTSKSQRCSSSDDPATEEEEEEEEEKKDEDDDGDDDDDDEEAFDGDIERLRPPILSTDFLPPSDFSVDFSRFLRRSSSSSTSTPPHRLTRAITSGGVGLV